MATDPKNNKPFDPEKFMKGIAHVESRGGKYMKNPNSSASGPYGHLYNNIPGEFLQKYNINSRDAFIADTAAHNAYMRMNIYGDMSKTPRKTNLFKDTVDLEAEYKPQLKDKFKYRPDEIAALSHYLGRDGARKYFGGIRDKKPYVPPGVNKPVDEYLKLYNEGLQGFEDGGSLKFLQPNSEKLPRGYVIPNKDSSTELAMSIGGEQGEPAYLIPSFKYGEPLVNPTQEFQNTGEHLGGPFKTWQDADKWGKEVRHPYVEKGQRIPSPLKWWNMENGGELNSNTMNTKKIHPVGKLPQKSVGGILSSTASGAASGLSMGGPWGALAGGVIGLGTGILGHTQEQKQLEEQEAANRRMTMDAFKATRTQALFAEADSNSNFGKQVMMEYGGFLNYSKGQSHKGPNKGIPVDAQGNPSVGTGNATEALVEKGEVVVVLPNGEKYVFPKEMAKDVSKVMNRYKIRLGKDLDGQDTLARSGYNSEIQKLVQINEANKPVQEDVEEMPEYGGGGIFDIPELTFYGKDTAQPHSYYSPSSPTTIPITGQRLNLPNQGFAASTNQAIGSNVASGLFGIPNQYFDFPNQNQTPADNVSPYPVNAMNIGANTDYSLTGKTNLGVPTSQPSSLGEPYNPTGVNVAISGISGLVGAGANLAMAFGRKEPSYLQAPMMSAQTINLGEQRLANTSRAESMKAEARTMARKTGASKGEDIATAGITGAMIERNLGEQNAAVMTAEKQYNAQARQAAAGANQQSRFQANQFNAMLKDRYNQETNQYISAAVGNVTGAGADMNQARMSGQYLDMVSARAGYQRVRDPKTGKIVLAPIPGYKAFQPYE